jgi:demethylmenaquinone methyltransferase/2-methoxy-6-polyprenyl-1,4-benzoquinol methylase
MSGAVNNVAGGGGASKKEAVRGMFDDIAPTYDALNHFLSLGIDRSWRRKLVAMAYTRLSRADEEAPRLALRATRRALEHPQLHRGASSSASPRAGLCTASSDSFPSILDVATGTGDLAISLARRIPGAIVTGVDISEGMLSLGREKVSKAGLADRVTLETGDAEALRPPDGSFDCVTVAFGVRNFGDIPRGLGEMRRVLRPGGVCYVLEFSEPTVPIFGPLYRFYFHRVLPWVGRVASRDGGAYSYLPRSVDGFPAPERFSAMLREAGFTAVRIKRLTFGVAYIYEAER